MWAVLVLALAANDPVTEAGTAYRQALQAVEAENYEEAILLLRTALQRVGEESNELKYRDSTARHRHGYYPNYLTGVTRQLQAKREASVFARRDLLKDAISRLSQTLHPEGAQRLEEVKTELAAVEKAIALDGSFAATKTRIEVLGTGERFEEAFQQLEEATKNYLTRQKEIADLRSSLKERQTALERRYEQVLQQRLGDVALVDPVTAGESIIGILKPAQIPGDAISRPGLPFQWLHKFLDLWEKHLEVARRAADLPAEETIAVAAAFEAAAIESLKSGVPGGFRAARHLSHAIRMAKLNRIASGAEDAIDTKAAASIVKSATESSARALEALALAPADDAMVKTLENDVPTRQKMVDELSGKIIAGAKERDRLTTPIVAAEASLSDPATLGSMAALTKLRNDLFELESEATFGSLTARLRARSLMAHALAEATLAFMEGAPVARVVDRCRVPAWRAYGFDPKVDARWSGRLSPKMVKILEQIKPQ